MAKNIVICCDGTSNKVSDRNTNVFELYSRLDLADPLRQIAYYHPGLGTMWAQGALTRIAKLWTEIIGLAFGYGLAAHAEDCYSFLMERYEEGDRVYLFGFSRGAYTMRVVAAMLNMFGLIRQGDEVLIPYAIELIKNWSSDKGAIASTFKTTLSRTCKPHFVGVWDTVSSILTHEEPRKIPFTTNNPDIAHLRHAVAIDERRAFFRQNLVGKPAEGQDYKQIWFAGVHTDVGGGTGQQEVSNIALNWMMREAAAQQLILKPGAAYPEDPTKDLYVSLKGAWVLAEYIPKRHWDWNAHEERWTIPNGRPRFMPEGSVLHQSVIDRMRLRSDYRPPNLPKDLGNIEV